MLEEASSDLRAELDALRLRINALESEHLSADHRPLWRAPLRFSRKFLMGAVFIPMVAAGGALFAATAGEALFIDSQGRVGIGTPTPAEKLQVKGGNILLDGGQQVRFSNGGTTNTPKIQLWDGYGLGINGGTLFYTANGKHSWRDSDGKERMALDTVEKGGLTVTGSGVSSFSGTVKAQAFETASGIALAGVPIGTIMAYGGDTANADVVKQLASQGWVPCDGRALARSDFADLFRAIVTGFGNGDNKTTFNVPDLRGRFVRGTDQGTNRDPDATSRISEKFGNSGDKPGSVQNDELRKHQHSYSATVFVGAGNGNMSGNHWDPRNAQTGEAGGNETRPKNVNVNWIIKVKNPA